MGEARDPVAEVCGYIEVRCAGWARRVRNPPGRGPWTALPALEMEEGCSVAYPTDFELWNAAILPMVDQIVFQAATELKTAGVADPMGSLAVGLFARTVDLDPEGRALPMHLLAVRALMAAEMMRIFRLDDGRRQAVGRELKRRGMLVRKRS